MNTPAVPLRRPLAALASVLSLTMLAGCVSGGGSATDILASAVDAKQQECMARAMYFESARSSEEGMLAVGTVVMNRVESPDFPNTVCGVVSQHNQFASGVMTRSMTRGRELAMTTSQKVLNGARHSKLPEARFFHTAGLSYGYGNMDYRAIAGGNAFYRKISPRRNPGHEHRTQAEVRSEQAANGPGRMILASEKPTALALQAPRKDQAEDNPFMQLWSGLTAESEARGPRPSEETGDEALRRQD